MKPTHLFRSRDDGVARRRRLTINPTSIEILDLWIQQKKKTCAIVLPVLVLAVAWAKTTSNVVVGGGGVVVVFG
jgi:hypothetical protein